MRQLNHAILPAVDQVDRPRRADSRRQAGKATAKGDHPRRQRGLGFYPLQGHDRPLREADQRRGLWPQSTLLLPVTYRFNKGGHDGVHAFLTILLRDALHGEPLPRGRRTAGFSPANANDQRIRKAGGKAGADLSHGDRIIGDAGETAAAAGWQVCPGVVLHGSRVPWRSPYSVEVSLRRTAAMTMPFN